MIIGNKKREGKEAADKCRRHSADCQQRQEGQAYKGYSRPGVASYEQDAGRAGQGAECERICPGEGQVRAGERGQEQGDHAAGRAGACRAAGQAAWGGQVR